MKVCNTCGARWQALEVDTCPECLQTGRGDVRDYHFDFEEAAPAVPAATGESVSAAGEKTAGSPATPEQVLREDLELVSRADLLQMARERGLEASGTKADLIDRLLAHGQG